MCLTAEAAGRDRSGVFCAQYNLSDRDDSSRPMVSCGTLSGLSPYLSHAQNGFCLMTSPLDAPDLVVDLLVAAGLQADEANVLAAEEKLGRSLVWFGQEYLSEKADEWDVELFFETYGVRRGDVRGWASSIVAGLASRVDIPVEDRELIVEKARQRAIEQLQL